MLYGSETVNNNVITLKKVMHGWSDECGILELRIEFLL